MESLLPDWAPNIHPILVHFPIALLVIAVVASLAEVIFSGEWISKARISLYAFGTLSALVAVLSGREAADSVDASFSAEITMGKHSDMGHYTLYFFIVFTVVQLLIMYFKKSNQKIIKIIFLVVGVLGLILLVQTGDLGAQLVYKYGVGVHK